MRCKRIVTTVATIFALAVLAAPVRADTVTPNSVTHWSEIAAAPLTPQGTLGVVHLAMVHGAIYDAVNAIDGGHEPYLSKPSAMPMDSKDAAVAAAAHDVLVGVLTTPTTLPPGTPPATLESDYAAALAAIPDGPAKTGGVKVGQAAAKAMLDARASDGRRGPFRFIAGSGVGQWRPELPSFISDPNAWLKDVTPFTVKDGSQFGSDPPYALTSKKYAREFNEVKALGRDTNSTRTQAQTDQALFYFPNPVRLWSSIARTLATQEGLSTVDSARYYAMTFMAAADSLITVWNDKAKFSFWRPITAIREAANDGNPWTSPPTAAEGAWLPQSATPPYPEHPSGHSSLAGAVTETARLFFGTDDIAFSATNPDPGPTRSFTSLSQARQEVVDARVWEGIHFRHADEAGAKIGRKVAKWIDRKFFGPVRRHHHHDDGNHDDGNHDDGNHDSGKHDNGNHDNGNHD
jgi:PAP2 superfamily